MPAISSFRPYISGFRQEVIEKKSNTTIRFAKLRELFETYMSDTQDLTIMTYGTSLIGAERNYDGLKDACKLQHQSLKQSQRNLDERTLAIEQKLYLGLPDDLTAVEKIITEQESILADQEKINQMEEELLEKMRKIDIDYGKQLASIEQKSAEREPETTQKQSEFAQKIDAEERKILSRTKLFALVPRILVPIAIDTLAVQLGLQKTAESHFIFAHYFFFISFILVEVFFSGKIKAFIADRLSKQSCLTLLAELEAAWVENETDMQKLEKEYNISLAEINDWLDA